MVEIGKIEFCVPATEFGGQVPDQNYVGISTLKKHSQGSCSRYLLEARAGVDQPTGAKA